MRRFFAPINRFTDNIVTLDADETRHLRDVLRLNVGDEVSVFDGAGKELACTIREIGKKETMLSITGEIEPSSQVSPFAITIAATVLNGEKYDLIVQKAVELGVTKLIPLITIRCDVKQKDAARRLERWRRIAMEATKQTGRAKLMEIAEPADFDRLLNELKDENAVLFSERDGVDFTTITADKKITALYGPKGGWDDVELKMAAEHDIDIVTLGGRILRAETAAIAITAILQHRFGDLN
ncbi:MAG TPA: 16S rRNA (uracil(1498)-N(3))-methyltransferase [Pyrinomonadaceae bacterium]|nr:16S rRNA (uracil(1498)-N(3))-methyltransferase [Pyrinomonadaceae bacterium]